MKLSDFDYELPKELIAKTQMSPRDHSRLLVIDKENGKLTHHTFYEIIDFLKKGDLLVLNDSKVFPARLFGKRKETGGQVEVLLNMEITAGTWEVLGRNIRVGDKIKFTKSKLSAEVMKKYEEVYEVKFNYHGQDFFKEIEKIGHTPLPPYIKRKDNKMDRRKYQTVYADKLGSVAAPTAGLHFTKKLLERIRDKGIIIAKVTLHVGLGTFAPIKEEKIKHHKIHSEYYSVNKNELQKIISAKKEGRRIIAVGTTSTRVLETVFSNYCHPRAGNAMTRGSNIVSSLVDSRWNLPRTLIRGGNDISGETNIFIYPGYKFKCVDGIITNFHLPKSTLLMLVSAFADKPKIDSAYKEAIQQKYRFYSYGDAMLII